MVGQFSLGLAITTPVVMFANLNLRTVQATDAQRLHSFGEYLGIRSISALTAIAVIGAIICLQRYEIRTMLVILALACAKGVESLSDIHYGLFQLNERLDHTGQSMILRGVLSVLVLSMAVVLTRDVLWACASLSVVWLLALIGFDYRRGRSLVSHWPVNSRPKFQSYLKLVRLGLPLGIVATLASVNLNVPRYFIAARMGAHQLGIFSALAYATVAATLISDSLGSCALPRLSRLYASGDLVGFRQFLFKLSALGVLIGLVGVFAAAIAGKQLLGFFYSTEYAVASDTFLLLMFATAIQCVAGMLTSGILSARLFAVQVPLYALVVTTTALACNGLVPSHGLAGGAKAMIVGSLVRLILTLLVIGYIFAVRGKSNRMWDRPFSEWMSLL